MKISSKSNSEANFSLLGEINPFCYLLLRSILYSKNTCCVTVQNNVFGAKCVLYSYNFSEAARHINWFLWSVKKSYNYYFTVKSLLAGNNTTLESTMSPTNFDLRLPTGLKKLFISCTHLVRIEETIKIWRVPVLRISNKRTAFFKLDQLSITLICVPSYDRGYNVYLFPIGL